MIRAQIDAIVGGANAIVDFAAYRRQEVSLQELADQLGRAGLATATHAMCDLQLALIADAVDADAVMVPDDPEADDPYAEDESDRNLAWTLGHVVAHTTASAEEAAALALVLARGLPIDGRSRYETPWQRVTTADGMRARVQESRRMRIAMLEAWPDRPHLENLWEARAGVSLNAAGRFLAGLSHDDSHLDQIRAIMAQCRAARRQTAGSPRRLKR